jgi:hypothetical protein
MVVIDRRVGLDLTQMARLIGMSVCPSPKGDGMELCPFLCDGNVEFPSRCLVSGVSWLLPRGGDGRGV